MPMPAGSESSANIIAQAASLSALPVHPCESPPPHPPEASEPPVSVITATPVETAEALRTMSEQHEDSPPVYAQLMVPTSVSYQQLTATTATAATSQLQCPQSEGGCTPAGDKMCGSYTIMFATPTG